MTHLDALIIAAFAVGSGAVIVLIVAGFTRRAIRFCETCNEQIARGHEAALQAAWRECQADAAKMAWPNDSDARWLAKQGFLSTEHADED